MWAISLTIVLLFPLLSAAPLDIAGGVKDDDGMHSHDENVTRAGKFFGNRFDVGNINVSGSVAGDDVSIGHQVNIDVHGHTHDHRHREDDTVIECKEGLREMFKSIDSNKDGLMDAKELLRVCHQNNIKITESLAVRILTLPDKTVGFNMAKFCELLKDCPSNNSAGLINFLLQLFDKAPCSGTESDWNCCSSTSPCKENEGDCDTDDDCIGSLVCGKDNCRSINPLAQPGADCCIQPVEEKYEISPLRPQSKVTDDSYESGHASSPERPKGTKKCFSISDRTTNQWCTDNCLHTPPNCPEDMCKCEGIIVDGGWSAWSSWSDCTGTCEEATKTRTRACSSTAGDKWCPGTATQTQSCDLPSCEESCTNKLVPGMSSVFLGYDMILGDPTAEGSDKGYMSAIFDEEFECKNNYVNSKPTYDKKCDNSFNSVLYFESKDYSKTVFSESSYGVSMKLGSDVEVEAKLGVPEASVSMKKTIPNHIQASASNTEAMRSSINALDSTFLTMAKSEATCYHYKVKILKDQHPRFTGNFKRAVQEYEDCMIDSHQNTEKKAECAKSFFNSYGTHYIEVADVGASMTYTKFYQNDKTSKMTSQSKKECSSYEAEKASFMVTTSAYKKSCDGDESSQSKIEAFQVKQSRFVTRGSIPANNLFDWAKQNDDIVIIRKLIKPLSNLFTSSYFEDDDVKDLAKTQLWLAQHIVDYCEIFRKERRCNYATEWKFTIPSTCKDHQYLQGTWTGPLNENLLPHGEGIFEKHPTKLKFFYNGCPRKDLLPSGGMMVAGDKLTSPNRKFTMLMGVDGDLVIYDANNKVWWTTKSKNYLGAFLKFDNGNLALYDGAGSKMIWNSQTEDNDADRLVMQNDGNSVLYTKDGTVLWKAIRDVLLPGEKLIEGDQLTSQDGNYKVFLQRDGDLVIKRSNGFLWWSMVLNGGPDATTRPGSGSYFQFQRSGNLVVSNKEGKAVWDSSTGGHYDAEQLKIHNNGALVLYAGSKLIWQSQRDVLKKGEKLWAGQSLRSPNLAFEFAVQRDGNMVVWQIHSNHRTAKRASGTNARGAGTALVFQWDGNLVLAKAGNVAAWDSDTAGSGADHLVMQNDGNLVLYTANGEAPWKTNEDFDER